MNLPLSLHLLIHITLSLLAGLLVYKIWQKPLFSYFSALIGGVAVDFDHFIDYFMAFGWHFSLKYFENGYQFLKTDKLYILFHGWEYVIILILAMAMLKNRIAKSVFLALALGLFFHLCADVVIDQLPIASYSVINRTSHNFELRELVYSDHWQRHLEKKETVEF